MHKTVIVTGVTSFLGLHVAAAFAKAGYPVVGTCFTPPHRLDRLRGARLAAAKKSGVEIRNLDICDIPAIRRLVLAERPRIWVQQAGIGRDFAAPNYNSALADRINIEALDGTYASLADSGAKVILTGSGMEYGLAPPPCPEDAPCSPRTLYGLSRLSATRRAQTLAERHKLTTRVARIFTVFGEWDTQNRFVTRLIDNLAAERKVDIAPATLRDICDVRDVAKAYVRLAEADAGLGTFEIFNVSRGAAISLMEFAVIAALLMGKNPGLVRENPAMIRPEELPELSGASDKAHRLLGWSASPLAEGLTRMVAQTDHRLRESA